MSSKKFQATFMSAVENLMKNNEGANNSDKQCFQSSITQTMDYYFQHNDTMAKFFHNKKIMEYMTIT